MTEIPPDHPRAKSLRIREKLIENYKKGAVAEAGLIAHGRGEAFDYILGEKSTENAFKAMEAAAALLFAAEYPVISVNGNSAALVAEDLVKLAKVTGAKLEVNLFHYSRKREETIKELIKEAGGGDLLLDNPAEIQAEIPGLKSNRRKVDSRGIWMADAVLVPLEDGDRTEALVKMNKGVVAIDLNPLSRTAQSATITIVDNIVRALPELIEIAEKLKNKSINEYQEILQGFNNRKNLAESIALVRERLSKLSGKDEF